MCFFLNWYECGSEDKAFIYFKIFTVVFFSRVMGIWVGPVFQGRARMITN